MNLSSLRLWPTQRQWKNWSIPSRLTAIGAYVGVLALALTVVFLCISTKEGAEGEVIIVDWGVENADYYEARKVNWDTKPPDEAKDFFAPDWWELYSLLSSKTLIYRIPKYIAEYFETSAAYRDECTSMGKKYDAGEFIERLRAKDPFFDYKEAMQTGPELFFDFVGNKTRAYVLTSIDVNTIVSAMHLGGGFTEDEARYDIILSPEKGKKKYEIDKKLVFGSRGTGRIVLSFWSVTLGVENFLIQITFNFLVDGINTVSVDTEPFAIDMTWASNSLGARFFK